MVNKKYMIFVIFLLFISIAYADYEVSKYSGEMIYCTGDELICDLFNDESVDWVTNWNSTNRNLYTENTNRMTLADVAVETHGLFSRSGELNQTKGNGFTCEWQSNIINMDTMYTTFLSSNDTYNSSQFKIYQSANQLLWGLGSQYSKPTVASPVNWSFRLHFNNGKWNFSAYRNESLFVNQTETNVSFNYSELYFNTFAWTGSDYLQYFSCWNGTPEQAPYITQPFPEFFLDNCSNITKYSVKTLNFTIRDEGNSSIIPADVTATFNYTMGGNYKTYTVEKDGITNFTVCMYPPNATFTGDYTITYENTNYPQRSNIENSMNINNITLQIPLYLLYTNDGIYVRFQVADQYSNPLDEVNVDMQNSDGDTIEVQSTDDSGLATFWVNPDSTYSFIFTKTGYETQTYSLRPTTSEIYTITMPAILAGVNHSYSTGISYGFLPSGSMLNNNTDYSFIFNLTSSYWTITGCTLYLKNSTATYASSSTSYDTTKCNINITYNTDNLTTIISEAIYYVNGTSQTVSVQYAIEYTYEGDFSLRNFLDDLEDFGDMGFNDFTRMVIAFILIVAILYGTASKQVGLGLQDEEALIVFTIALVWFFSYIGWFTINYDPIPSVFLKKWILWILVTLLGGGYLLKKHTD